MFPYLLNYWFSPLSAITQQFKKQFPRNSFFQLLTFVIQIGVGFWLVPYLIGHIGVAAYGLILIAGLMTQYVNLISQSISTSVNRFLSIALQNNDYEESNSIFSTAFFSYFAIGLFQIPIILLVLDTLEYIIHIPVGLYEDTILLILCSALAFIVNLVASIFGVPMYANNRLDISRIVDIFRLILRVVGIATLFLVFHPALRFVGFVDLGISVVLFVVQFFIAKYLAPDLELKLRFFDRKKVKQLTGMGGWLLINNLGALLFLRTDLWICNRFVGVEAAGQYAAILQWPALIRSGGAMLSAVIAPMITIYYARSELDNLLRLGKVSIRIFSIAIAVPISIICVVSPSLLNLWLGNHFVHLAPLLILMLFHLTINVGVMPLFNIQTAMNKVKIPALVTLVAGLINMVIAIVFVKYLDWGIYGVALSGAIVLTIKNALFTPVYAAYLLCAPWHTFIKPYLPSLVLFTSLVAIGYIISQSTTLTSVSLIAYLSACMVGVGLISSWFILTRDDRRMLLDLLPFNNL